MTHVPIMGIGHMEQVILIYMDLPVIIYAWILIYVSIFSCRVLDKPACCDVFCMLLVQSGCFINWESSLRSMIFFFFFFTLSVPILVSVKQYDHLGNTLGRYRLQDGHDMRLQRCIWVSFFFFHY
jgi:hypothetical protein